jgi:enamine deaminase RidA (YjgF/YER057c/UK114 family)
MYLTDIRDSAAIDQVFTEFFPARYPARTVVQVVALVLPELRLEIQASAVLDR